MALYEAPLIPPQLREISRVVISSAPGYHASLSAIITQAIREVGLHVRGKSILLKPDFSVLDPLCLINTHPAVVAAARESFLRLGARSVIVADAAPSRDTEAILESMDARQFLGSLEDNFADLNFDNVHEVPLRTRHSRLQKLWLPEALLTADVVVSVPRLKIDSKFGVALSLKNMLGVLPGCCYGWPPSLIKRAGFAAALLDVNATVLPDFVVVDGIVGMEGDGPVGGQPHPCGVLVMGRDPVAVDATCVRVMGLLPERIHHLRRAARRLGHIRERSIAQLGERILTVQSPFVVPEELAHLRPGSRTAWLGLGNRVAL